MLELRPGKTTAVSSFYTTNLLYSVQYALHANVHSIKYTKKKSIRDRFILSNDNTQTAALESHLNSYSLYSQNFKMFSTKNICSVYFTEMFLNLFSKPSTICVEERTSVPIFQCGQTKCSQPYNPYKKNIYSNIPHRHGGVLLLTHNQYF